MKGKESFSLCHVICGTKSHDLTLYCHRPRYKYLRTNHIGKQSKQNRLTPGGIVSEICAEHCDWSPLTSFTGTNKYSC